MEDGGSQGWKCQGGVWCVTYTEHKIHPHICDSANKLQLGQGPRDRKYVLTCLRSKKEKGMRQKKLSQVEANESG